MSLDINLTNVQSKPIVVSANQTAENDRVYHVVANATFTDPTGVNGKGYEVFVRNGTATIGGANFTHAGTIIKRTFHSGSWATVLYSTSQFFNSPDETVANKSTNVNTDQASDSKYPSVKAVFDWATNLFFPKPTGTTAQYLRGDGTTATFPTIPSITGLVPYTGATQDVDLGEYELKAGQVEFDQTPTGTAGVAVMRWNDTDGTIDLGLKGGNVTLQLGQEQLVRVVNKTATNINLLEANYQAVRVTGAQGQRLKVDLAQATNDALSAETIGLVTETINNNQEGFITTSGLVRNINTTGSLQGETWADGDVVYLSATTAGRITNVKPSAPNHLVIIGYVVSAHATQGSIFVKVDNGYELDELHNVAISTPLNNQSLVYETATTLWKNKALTAIDVGAVATNSAITGATKTKITYDSKGLVTSGADATTADIADSTNKRYQTDNQQSFNDATSSIQTQLDTKQSKLLVKKLGASATIATTVESIIGNVEILGGTLASTDYLNIKTRVRKTGSNGTYLLRYYINTTSNSLTGATQIAISGTQTTSSIISTSFERDFTIDGGNLIGFPFSTASNDGTTSASTVSSVAYTVATTYYIITTITLASALDTASLIGQKITNL
jgi:hypothetical protein